MQQSNLQTCTAFSSSQRIASGSIKDVALKVKEHLEDHPQAAILIFDNQTSQQVELDLRGTVDAVLKRLEKSGLIKEEEPAKGGPGRPKLGVTSKEVTLLPQHWDWLAKQPGGASVTLRRLVDEAKKKNAAKDLIRQSQDATYKFMTVMAGDLPDYEEALRALYAKDAEKFKKLISKWPEDVRAHINMLAEPSL
ncbi:hypothetical protein AZI87_05710 [Bdellovibrio bacteriovorus]|uniref:DUF2239 domain-containing protein n=1 Tax=Bdellovibrio bacteriovorus TaxID=959 RepID=A0A162GQT1_BDEBC|nr:DUF2239 family protein [Bdellovibrio bacteriovorus]KYG68726.1 hypothetical protein AZI87_05710 [Bdellovibrio bacteriovorus]